MLSPQTRDRLKQSVPGLASMLRVRARFSRPARTRAYLARHSEPALHLGCGGNLLDGWLNTDLIPERSAVVPLDSTRPLPFAAHSFNRVFSEHMIEHIPFSAACALFAECHRVLRPGGFIRLATPDLARICGLHAAQAEPGVAAYLAWSRPRYAVPGPGSSAAHVVNSLFYHHGHRFLFDADTLSAALAQAGFRDCTVRIPGQSGLPGMSDLEHHGHVMGHAFNNLETLVVEAVA